MSSFVFDRIDGSERLRCRKCDSVLFRVTLSPTSLQDPAAPKFLYVHCAFCREAYDIAGETEQVKKLGRTLHA